MGTLDCSGLDRPATSGLAGAWTVVFDTGPTPSMAFLTRGCSISLFLNKFSMSPSLEVPDDSHAMLMSCCCVDLLRRVRNAVRNAGATMLSDVARIAKIQKRLKSQNTNA